MEECPNITIACPNDVSDVTVEAQFTVNGHPEYAQFQNEWNGDAIR